MTTIINGSSPSITFSDSTTQTTAFNGQALSASPYTTSLGASTLVNNTGTSNTAIGNGALAANTTASNNTAVGYQAIYSSTTASNNTALGYQAGYGNTLNGNSTFVGYQAGFGVTGAYVTALGYQAVYGVTTGNDVVGVGYRALYSNTSGGNNTAVGDQALQANTTASNNTAVGYQAGYSNTTGLYNVFLGQVAGYSNTTSANSTYIGQGAGYSTTGTTNTFLGNGSGYYVSSGTKNTILGCYSGNQGGLDIRTASNYIVLSDGDGNPRFGTTNTGTIFSTANGASLGTTTAYHTFGNATNDWVARFYNSDTGGYGIGAYVNNDNASNFCFGGFSISANVYRIKIYTNGNIQNTNNSYGALSDIKLKENIVDASPKLNDLMQVKVRQYSLKNDATKRKQIGVIAQELEEVFPNMVDETADLDSNNNDLGTTTKGVKYSVFVPMLIKAVQELKAEFDAYKATHP